MKAPDLSILLKFGSMYRGSDRSFILYTEVAGEPSSSVAYISSSKDGCIWEPETRLLQEHCMKVRFSLYCSSEYTHEENQSIFFSFDFFAVDEESVYCFPTVEVALDSDAETGAYFWVLVVVVFPVRDTRHFSKVEGEMDRESLSVGRRRLWRLHVKLE